MSSTAIRGILKPMPGYVRHLRAGVSIPQHGREFVVDPESKPIVLDEPGKPLVLSTAGYECMREAFGTQLVCEPWDGAPRPAAQPQRTPEEELAESRKKIAELEERLVALEGAKSRR